MSFHFRQERAPGRRYRPLEAIGWGGEEFLMILPRTEPDEAEALAQRLREQTEGQPFAVGDQSLQVTISIGVATTQTDDVD
ncbi:diguanylate cyclase [Salinisphaera sp. C84B14]|uniref:GGDEF domain-containing protein n=1 Tax=Salinisphaera sp. C84B14 TaxID=1304155 RepID=UPI00333F7BB5